VELLKQGQYSPMAFEDQALVVFAGTAPGNYIIEVPVTDVVRYEKELLEFAHSRHQPFMEKMRSVAKLTDEIKSEMDALLTEFGPIFSS
jgi:F-type H+-transporting ATPase subunit alpha